jgi:hypothetical protein
VAVLDYDLRDLKSKLSKFPYFIHMGWNSDSGQQKESMVVSDE